MRWGNGTSDETADDGVGVVDQQKGVMVVKKSSRQMNIVSGW